MKKAILYIVAILAITSAVTVASEFSLIPKPDTLPGPSIGLQESEGGARNILVDIILPRFAVIAIGIIGSLALVFVMIGGIRLATAYGNEEDIEKGKKQVIYGVVGFILALLAFTIVQIVINLEFVETNPNQTTSTQQAK